MVDSVPLNLLVLSCLTPDYEMKGTIYRRFDSQDFARCLIYGEIDALVSLGYAELWEESYGTAAIWRYYRITNKGRRRLASMRKETHAYA